MAVDVGEATVDAVVTHGQFFVVDAKQVQDGGKHIVAGRAVFAFPAPMVALAKRAAALRAASGKPSDECAAIMVAPGLALTEGHPPELRRPNDKCVL